MEDKEFKNNLVKTIICIIDQYPAWWIIFSDYIVSNHKITYCKESTLIINLYKLSDFEVTILYNVLKELKKQKIVIKILHEKEFLIVHFNNKETLLYCVQPINWRILVISKALADFKVETEIDIRNCSIYNKDIKLQIDEHFNIFIEPFNVKVPYSNLYQILVVNLKGKIKNV